MRALIIGCCVGIGLSVSRAPLGVELVQISGTAAGVAMAFRAGGLALAALGVLLAAPRLEGAGFGARLMAGLALGFGLHGLVLGWSPGSHRGMIGVGIALAFCAFLAGRAGVKPVADAEEQRERRPARPGAALGLALCGAGLAVVLESVARPLRWFGGGLPEDDALFASCLLIPAALVALAFVRALRGARAGSFGRLIGAPGTALGGLAGLWVLSGFGDPRRLQPHLARFGVDPSEHGTFAFDVWIAVPTFALAALGLGLLAASLRRREQWAALTIGALAATIALPRLFAVDSPFSEPEAFELVRAGAVATCVGALLASWAEDHGEGRPVLRLGVGLPLLLGALYLPLPALPLPLHRAWSMQPPQILFQQDAPEGRLTVEVRGGVGIACLDGRALTPELEDRETERRLIHAAWRARPEGTGRRVLFLGQLGPARAAALSELGLTNVDRCTAWVHTMQRLEEYAYSWEGKNTPAGRRLGPREARARLFAGEYDWVYAPPTIGRAPATRQLGGPAGLPGAIAFDGASRAAERGLGARVIPVQTGLERLAVLALVGPASEGTDDAAPSGLAVPAERPWRVLGRREDERPRHYRARLARRLADANRGGAAEAETLALALQLEAQRRSSPYETPAERVEIDRENLAAWTAAALADAPTALVRSALEDLAVLLTIKRMPAEAREFLTPVADRHWPWPALERALALAELELLDPASALERLGALAEEGGVQGADWWLLAWVQAAAGELQAAEESAARARKGHFVAPEWEQHFVEELGQQQQVGPAPPNSGDQGAHNPHR